MNKPEKVFQCGNVQASIWLNERRGNEGKSFFYNVRIEKVYKDGEEWKRTNSFSAWDLPKLQIVAGEAYKYLMLKTREPESEVEVVPDNLSV